MAKSKTVKTTTVEPTTQKAEPPVIKVRDLSWPLRTLIALAAVGGAIMVMYLFFILYVLATTPSGLY